MYYIYLLLVGSIFANISLDPKDNKITSQFIDNMHNTYKIPTSWLQSQFDGARFNQKAISLIQRPLESKPWSFYQKLFVTARRTAEGKKFLQKHSAFLTQCEKEYHIPKEVVVAILGVETNYGTTMGDFNALEVLSTLSFYYVPRHAFFRSELESLVQYAWKYDIDLHKLNGSYAGAIGASQFMPSNILKYAKSADNSTVDLLHKPHDAILSVFNYLKKHGKWTNDTPIAANISLNDAQKKYLQTHYPDSDSIAITPMVKEALKLERQPYTVKYLLVSRDTSSQEAQIAYANFSSIMTYNISVNYARSVYLLSEALK